MKYTECEKLKDVSEESQSIGQFLEWLSEQQLAICEIQENFECGECGEESQQYVQHYKRIEERLADYFGIDLVKVEKERRHILEQLQKDNKK